VSAFTTFYHIRQSIRKKRGGKGQEEREEARCEGRYRRRGGRERRRRVASTARLRSLGFGPIAIKKRKIWKAGVCKILC
jgi:hypothetical protein